MLNTSVLLARPLPVAGESPASPLLRAAGLNGFPNVAALLSAHGLQYESNWIQAAFTDAGRYARMIQAVGLDNAFCELAFRRQARTSASPRIYRGIPIAEELFREDGNTYCPACLESADIWKGDWLLQPITVCTTHSVRLVSGCYACGKTLSPTRGSLRHCPCGADLREADRVSCDVEADAALSAALQCADGSMVTNIMRLWRCLWEMISRDSSSVAKSVILGEAVHWSAGQSVPGPEVLRLLRGQTIGFIHPRLTALPLLKEQDRFRDYAAKLLASLQVFDEPYPASLPGHVCSSDASITLGVGPQTVKKLLVAGHLDAGPPQAAISVSIDSINRLLHLLNRRSDSPPDRRRGCRTEGLADVIERIKSNETLCHGFDLQVGIRSLRYSDVHAKKPVASGAALSVNEIALELDVHGEVVRSLARKNHLVTLPRANSRSPIMAERSVVERFKSLFVTGGQVARKAGVSPQNFSEKLVAVGACPIAGPTIDGTLVYLFDRRQVTPSVVKRALETTEYETRAGRRSAADRRASIGGVSIAESSSRLAISTQQVTALLVSGHLAAALGTNARAARIDEVSLTRIEKALSSDRYISDDDACATLGVSKPALFNLWVQAGVLEVLDLGCWRLFEKADVAELASLLRTHITARDAGRLLGLHRSHFPNLERRGLIKSKMLGKQRKIRLYSREEVSAIRNANL